MFVECTVMYDLYITLQVKDLLMEMTDEVSGQLVVACFLIREGADTTDKNRQGQTPLDVCSPEMAVLLSAFAERYAKYALT